MDPTKVYDSSSLYQINRRDVYSATSVGEKTQIPEKANCSPKTDRGAMLMEPGTPLPDETSQTIMDLKSIPVRVPICDPVP